MNKTVARFGMPLLLSALGLFAACADTDPSGDEGGLDMRSRGTDERNERFGNDPAEQNTGEGSVPSADVEDNPPEN